MPSKQSNDFLPKKRNRKKQLVVGPAPPAPTEGLEVELGDEVDGVFEVGGESVKVSLEQEVLRFICMLLQG